MKLITLLFMALFLLTGCGEQDMGQFRVGLTDSCRAQASFVVNTGLSQPVALDSRQRGYKGLRLVSMRTQKTWQHPSWDDLGHIGAFARDRQGHIYVVAVPNVSLSAELMAGLPNKLYRIDAVTGEMAFFMDLPAVAAPSTSNPFGIMGLFYDCDTDSLYVSSVAGSSSTAVNGRIYQVDVAGKKVVAQLAQTDALGIAVFNGPTHKRLYLGSARTPDIYSVALDATGGFSRDVRHEFSLSELPGGNTSNARKITIQRDKQGTFLMKIKEQEFGFRLLAENNNNRRIYQFSFVQSQDQWAFQNAVPEP